MSNATNEQPVTVRAAQAGAPGFKIDFSKMKKPVGMETTRPMNPLNAVKPD